MDHYLDSTALLDFKQPPITDLLAARQWANLPQDAQIAAIYDFVQNEIAFGYNAGDSISACEVLRDGYGQCNTKSTLLMALLRACGVPCRFHGFTVTKTFQRGAITGLAYLLAPRNIVHSWVEVLFQDRWVHLEGVILDRQYLRSVQARFGLQEGTYCGYGAATTNLQNPGIEWTGAHTYIQKECINQDFGVFDSPDAFYAAHGGNLRGIKRLLYQHYFRQRINANVARIRRQEW